MGFADDVAAVSTPNRARCTVGIALEQLSKKDRAEAVEVIAGTAPGSAIARVLSARAGIRITGRTVQRHRHQECSCGDR